MTFFCPPPPHPPAQYLCILSNLCTGEITTRATSTTVHSTKARYFKEDLLGARKLLIEYRRFPSVVRVLFCVLLFPVFFFLFFIFIGSAA